MQIFMFDLDDAVGIKDCVDKINSKEIEKHELPKEND